MGPLVKLLADLVAIPSVNPALLPSGNPHVGEERVTAFLESRARAAGLDCERSTVLPGRHNLFVRLKPPRTPRQTVLLAPHLDTVGGLDVPGNLFTPVVNGGRLYGRGACDTKGSVAAMFSALLAVAHDRPPAETEIVLAGLVDEESGQLGSRKLASDGFKADLAIVGEPTQLKVITAHKGVLWLQMTTTGRAAHGARPELGCNAVHAMARIVDLLETRYAAGLRRKKHPLLGRATINVGSISGGTQPNIVPSRCVISIDRRTLPGERDEAIYKGLRTLLKSKGLTAEFDSLQGGPCMPLETSPRLPLVAQFMSVAGQRKPAGVDYFSDGAVLASGGSPSVLFGPGDIAQAHTPDEWISIESLEKAERLLIRFLRSLP